jgi:hypothetical protein
MSIIARQEALPKMNAQEVVALGVIKNLGSDLPTIVYYARRIQKPISNKSLFILIKQVQQKVRYYEKFI